MGEVGSRAEKGGGVRRILPGTASSVDFGNVAPTSHPGHSCFRNLDYESQKPSEQLSGNALPGTPRGETL